MCKHAPARENSGLLVEYGAQQIVGVEHAFHQNRGFSFADKAHSFAGGLVAVGRLDKADVGGMAHQLCVLLHFIAASYEYGVGESMRDGASDSLLGGGVGGPHHSHGAPVAPQAETFDELVKICDHDTMWW